MKKSETAKLLIFLAFIFIFNNLNYIRYVVTNGSEAGIGTPDTFVFRDNYQKGNVFDTYYASYEEYYPDINYSCYDKATNTYHIFIDANYFNRNYIELTASGYYCNSPKKPTALINNQFIGDISARDTGHAESIFHKREDGYPPSYYSKKYYLSISGPIYRDTVYNFIVGIEGCNCTKSINVVFHAE